jgi:aminoglycoside phosphotransferase (APT) family kinase protein
MNAETLAVKLLPIVSRVASVDCQGDCRIENLRRLTGGSAAHTWRFALVAKDTTRELILRMAHPGDQFDGGLNKLQEATAQSSAFTHGVPVAQILHVLQHADGLGEGFVMACVEGETIPQKILRHDKFAIARDVMAAQCGRILATLHAVPLINVACLPNQTLSQQLDALRRSYDFYGEKLPVFNYAFRWLQQHMPAAERRTLVHGDFRNGNLMVNEAGINAVLDWELAHIGDPMEDLGWLCVNSWRFGNIENPVGGFGRREDLYRSYSAASGYAVDPQRVRFWELYGIVKWGVICLYQTHVHLQGKERSIERAAIGRRVSECEADIAELLLEQC